MQKLVTFLQESMDEYSSAEEQITKQVFETLNTCSRGDAQNAAVLQQKNTKTKQEFLDWYRNPKNYRPESPSANRSHKYE